MKNNPRISAKERGLIKGALRRVFSRSDLRRATIDASRVEHSDPDRPRVKKWSRCPVCNQFIPTYLMEADHEDPIVPIDSSLEDMTASELVDRMWCDPKNLVAKCKNCHHTKSKCEQKARKQNKDGKKKNGKRSTS